MAPDKIYVRQYRDGDISMFWDEEPDEDEFIGKTAVCYVRKDKIREMVMLARNMSQTPDAAIHNWDVLIKEIDKI